MGGECGPPTWNAAGPGLGSATLKSSSKGGRCRNTKYLHPQGLFLPHPGAALDLGSGCSGSVFPSKFEARGKPQNVFHGLLNPVELVHLPSLAFLAVWPLVICSPSLDLSVFTWKRGLENPTLQRPTLCDPIDGSPPGSPVPGILQASPLESRRGSLGAP